jgi:polar amino acid transport system permease protein
MAYDMQTTRPNPQKRNIMLRRIARGPWWLLIATFLIVTFIFANAPNPIYQDVFAQVRQGIWTTIWVSCVAYTLAIVMGLLLALLRLSKNPIIHQLSTLYVEVIRGIPTLVLVYFIVLALTPQLVNLVNELGAWLVVQRGWEVLGEGMLTLKTRNIDNTARAIAGLAISYSAFISEIFRAGIESVDRGQYDAALSMGMTRRQTLHYVILPQAFRNVLPPLANDFIALLKESSLVSIVGVQDITRQGSTYGASNFRFFESYAVIAVTYLVLTLSLAIMVKALENVLNRNRQNSS